MSDEERPDEMTSFEDGTSKAMREVLTAVRTTAAGATPADKVEADRLRRKGGGIRVEMIQPVVAALAVLQHNKKNRQISLIKLDDMVRDMRAHDWKDHHQGIAFNTNEELGDGQHRLMACALSGLPLKTVVASDFDMESIDAIDRSTKRTAWQAASMHGMEDAQAKFQVGKSVLEYVHQMQHGVKPRFSDQKLQRDVRANEAVLQIAVYIGRKSVEGVSAVSLSWKDAGVLAGILLVQGWPEGKVAEYLGAVQQGIATYPDSPTLIYARKLLTAKESINRSKLLSATTRIALGCKAARFWGHNVGISKLAWDERKEDLPDPSLELTAEVLDAAE